MQRTHKIVLAGIASIACLTTGCTTIPSWASRWPIVEPDRTSYSTPRMRIDAVREFATRSTGFDSADQREITDQLARQIQVEPDPLVRAAIVETIAEFRTPLAQQVLQAGLDDTEQNVRIACCDALGALGDAAAIGRLQQVLSDDDDIDVRLAAARALGGIRSPDSIRALAIALEDRDPAMQFMGVESLKSISGQDFGGDVQAWRQFAASDQPEILPRTTSMAERLRQAIPF